MVEKRENTGFRQKQIAVAAAELIVKYGSEHLTIKRLAGHTKLSEAAIYRHFSSKSDIYYFLLKHVETSLLADLRGGDSAGSIRPADIDALIDRHITGIERNFGVEFQVIAEIISMGDVALNRETLRIINGYIASLEETFSQRIKSKYIRSKVEAEYLAIAFFTLVQGLVYMWALSGYAFNLKHRFYQVWAVHNKALAIYKSKQIGKRLKFEIQSE